MGSQRVRHFHWATFTSRSMMWYKQQWTTYVAVLGFKDTLNDTVLNYGQSERRITSLTLGSYNKSISFAVGNYALLEKLLQACKWILVEIKHPIMGHQVAMGTELPIMSWVLSDPASHKFRKLLKQSIIRWKQYVCNQVWTGLEEISKRYRLIPQIPMKLTGVLLVLLSLLTSMTGLWGGPL